MFPWSLLAWPKIDAGLEEAFEKAVKAWSPYRALVSSVHWQRDVSCNDDWGGGRWIAATRSIAICWPPEHDVNVIMIHEYGHALGLQHVSRRKRLSVMNDGWGDRYEDYPTAADLEDVRRLRDG